MKDRDDAVWDADLETFVHPVAAMFPKLEESCEAFKDLEGSILSMHQLEPIVYDGDVLLDGRNRLAICRKFDRKPIVKEWRELGVASNDERNEIETKVAWIIAKNIARRHLTEDQRAAIVVDADQWEAKACEAKEKAQFKEGNDPKRNTTSGPKKLVDPKSGPPAKRDLKAKHANSTAGRVAAKAKVSRYKAEQTLKVKKGAPAVLQEVKDGKKTIKEAVSLLPEEKKRSHGSVLQKPLEMRVRDGLQKFFASFGEERERAVEIARKELL